MKLLEGKPIAARIKEDLTRQIQELKCKPVLASIQVGENAGAQAYANSQKKTAQKLPTKAKISEQIRTIPAGLELHETTV